MLQAARVVERQILGWEKGREAGMLSDKEGSSVGDLYGGTPGLALFWAAMARFFPERYADHAQRSREALLATRSHLFHCLAEPIQMDAIGARLGGIVGLGGALYTLTCVGTLLGDQEMLLEALAASALFTEERIARDRRFDLVDGCAGAVLSLLALDSSLELHGLPRGGILEAVHRCTRHLLLAQSGSPGEPRGWMVDDGISFCGFAHGAAGIVYALLRAHDRAPDPGCLQAARDAMAFERSLYRSGLGNWAPYTAFPEEGRPMVAWCWGAPGIALGRIAALDTLDSEEVREDIRRALRTTLTQPLTLEDHICCGNLGRAQILAYAARADLGDDSLPSSGSLLNVAGRLAHNVLRYAKGRGGFRWSPSQKETFQPFFFKGAAGVGYAFLYLAEPGMLPLPLLLEAPTGKALANEKP
jgi:lantibiotic modifying enzyme